MAVRSQRVQWIEGQPWPEPPGRMQQPHWLRSVGATLEDGQRVVRCRYDAGQQPEPGDVFRRFIRLDGAPAVRIRDFVARFGRLGIGPTGLPGAEDHFPMGSEPPFLGGETEDVRWYSHYAGLAAATVRIAAYLRLRREAEREDLVSGLRHWELLSDRVRAGDSRVLQDPVASDAWYFAIEIREELNRGNRVASADELKEARGKDGTWVGTADVPDWMSRARRRTPFHSQIVEAVVNWWLAAVQPLAPWNEDRSDFDLAWKGGLWGTLGLHLLYAVKGARGGSQCSNCGRFVRRQRAPKTGQQIWCDRKDCRRTLYRQAKARKRRERATQKVQLGHTV